MASARSTHAVVKHAAPAAAFAMVLAVGAVLADGGESGLGVPLVIAFALGFCALALLTWLPGLGVAIGLFIGAWSWVWSADPPGLGAALVGVALYGLAEATLWSAGGRHRLAGGPIDQGYVHAVVALATMAFGFLALRMEGGLAEGRPALVVGSVAVVGLLIIVGKLADFSAQS